MRRVVVLLAIAAILPAALLGGTGCGSKSYEERLAKTIEQMRYQKRLDENLMPPPKRGEGKFEELSIYIRPPKNLAINKDLLLTGVEPGKFDLESTFLDPKKEASLHVLGRVKKPANTKKKAAAPTNQGEFTADVLAVVNGFYQVTVDGAKFKEITKKPQISMAGNKFKWHPLEVNDKNVVIYIYGAKTDTYQVALIFEYPKAEHAALVSKIDLCLESFAVGNRARQAYSGSGEEEAGEAGGGGAAPPGVF